MSLLTLDEAAAYMRISKKTVYSYTHQRRIPFIKIGRRVNFRQDELDKWMNNGSTPEATKKIEAARKK